MAASPTPRPTASNPDAVLAPVQAALRAWALRQAAAGAPLSFPLGIAFSGGADSTALLVAAHACWPGQVHTLHVNHGLQPAAAGFEQHVQAFCAGLGLPLHVARVDARHAPGDSPEDAARRARYRALAALALEAGVTAVLLGQHADDQVETLLLALSRGAGLPGLAGMAAGFARHGMSFHRPLLELAGADLRSSLSDAGIDWIEDPSNDDEAYTRNRIRAQLLPALQQAFPQFRDTFARSARHAAQAQMLLQDIADSDLRLAGDPPAITALRALPAARQANALRRWLAVRHGTAASTAQMDELQRQLAACTTRGHRLHLKIGEGFVVREGDALAWYNPAVVPRGLP